MKLIVSAGFSEGHAFPALALSRALRVLGHDVLIQLSERWRETAEGLDLEFIATSGYVPFPGAAPGATGTTAAGAARSLAAVIREYGADVVVSDLVATAPPLAAELASVPAATLIPTVYPVQGAGLPPFPHGFQPPATPIGRRVWRSLEPLTRPLRPTTRWLRRVPDLIDETREELGLPRRGRDDGLITTYGPISNWLALVATFPQLEFPRRWPDHVHVTGPMRFEAPYPEVELPPGTEPLVLVAASTVQDDGEKLVAVALDALADEPVRVVGTLNRRGKKWTGPMPENAVVLDWLSYSQVLPQASLVICSGGHGTVARALTDGVPILVCPTEADSVENGGRVTWSGAGLMLPRRMLAPGPMHWAVRRLLADGHFAERARAIADWGREHDGAVRGAELIERYAGSAT
jgi:UDP:flavonoid glycosyltransferase YjiC (YdhE family)